MERAEAESSGFAVNEFLEQIRGPFTTELAFQRAGRARVETAVGGAGPYRLIESVGSGEAECPPRLELNVVVDLSSPTCSLLGKLSAVAAIAKGASPGYWRVRLLDGEHPLRGTLRLPIDSSHQPHGIVTSFDLVAFAGGTPAARLAIELLGFYRNDDGATQLDAIERGTPPDGCAASALLVNGDCIALAEHPDYPRE